MLPVNKPKETSSFDVVRTIRSHVPVKKVGHAGTLDPMATGLLIVLVARPATRLQDAFMKLRKTYTCTMRLGERTASHDAETEVEDCSDASGVSTEVIQQEAEELTGTINQIPPMYSAVKMGGERLYKKARRGETVERVPRQISVYAFEMTGRSGVDVSFRVECSKGTYVRSLARDLGDALGVGAHLTALRRTSIGPYSVDDAWPVDALTSAFEAR